MTLDLTNPKLARLIARYRAIIAEKNQRYWDWKNLTPGEDRYEVAIVNYKGFLDWCIREGIEAPKGNA
jgi:hypothetical protein